MNRSPSTPSTKTATQPGCWSLNVVRGRAVGQEYLLDLGETILGNACSGERGLELADQEVNSPRKMAARHAMLLSTNDELTIRDLESPGGTFVNQQRLLSGQARRLVPGDVIQLGGIQLAVKHNAASPPTAAGARAGNAAVVAAPAPSVSAPAARSSLPASPGRLSLPFSTAGGAQCRSWDDFLVLAAQSWPALRDELTSGRLAEYLRRIHRAELVPRLASDRSPDDLLDDWLARLPAAGSSAPELDVHPDNLLVRTATGGGITRQTLRITNVGYRLLRSTARVEPPGTRWVRLRPEHDGRPFQTIDQTDLPVELELPQAIDRSLAAFIVIESNGGTRRIAVRIERPTEQIVVPESSAAASSAFPLWRERLSGSVARLHPGARIAIAGGGAALLRLLAVLVNAVPIGTAPAHVVEPRLSAEAIILVVLGVAAGLTLASRRGERRDYLAAGFAGGSLGLLASAVWFAALQSVERLLGAWSTSIWAVVVLWGTLGALFALVSIVVIPPRSDKPEVAR